MPLSTDILSALSTLSQGLQSVEAVQNSSDTMNGSLGENRFTRALEDLQRLAESMNFPIAIVGGLGAIRYGYPAATEDIDVTIGKQDLDRFLRAAPEFGFQIAWRADSGWHTVTHGDVEINIVPEGGKARNQSPTTIPGPKEMGVMTGLDYASLASWMELKISSGRQKDLAHVVEVLKKCDVDQTERTQAHMAAVHPSYAATLERLIAEAKEEKQQENDRGNRHRE